MTDEPDAPDWADIFAQPWTVLIVGERGSGKTATGHRLLELFGGPESDRGAYIMGYPMHRRDELPDWIEPVPETLGMDEWPEDSTVLIHEAHHLLHARESMGAENLTVDKLVTISRHKNSNIIFETQQTQRLDRNAVASVDGVVVKWPALLQEEFERKQMRKIVSEAKDALDEYVDVVEHDDFTWVEKGDDLVKHAYVYSSRFRGEYPHDIQLADHWTESISKAYGDLPDGGGEGGETTTIDGDEAQALRDIAQWERDQRPLDFEIQGVQYDETSTEVTPHILSKLEDHGFLEKVYSSSNKPNRYRLTEKGWGVIDLDEPDAPVVEAED